MWSMIKPHAGVLNRTDFLPPHPTSVKWKLLEKVLTIRQNTPTLYVCETKWLNMVLNSITIVGTKIYQLLPVNVTVVETRKTAASVNPAKVNNKRCSAHTQHTHSYTDWIPDYNFNTDRKQDIKFQQLNITAKDSLKVGWQKETLLLSPYTRGRKIPAVT